MILGEREPVSSAEPLIISASLEGLKKVIARLAELREARSDDIFAWPEHQKYVNHSLQLEKVAEDIHSLIERLRSESRALLLVLGDEEVAGRNLMHIGSKKQEKQALGGPMAWPAHDRQLITYSDTHIVEYCPDMMPEPARYYPVKQLLIGNETGVIPFFRLNDIHERGGWVEVVQTQSKG